MANRADELKNTAAQCLALAQATTDPQARAALLTIRHGEQPARTLRGGPARIQPAADAPAASDAAAGDTATATNPAEERRIGRPISEDAAAQSGVGSFIIGSGTEPGAGG